MFTSKIRSGQGCPAHMGWPQTKNILAGQPHPWVGPTSQVSLNSVVFEFPLTFVSCVEVLLIYFWWFNMKLNLDIAQVSWVFLKNTYFTWTIHDLIIVAVNQSLQTISFDNPSPYSRRLKVTQWDLRKPANFFRGVGMDRGGRWK